MLSNAWSTYCLRRIRIAAFLFCAALGLVAAIFLIVYEIREWNEYNVSQRTLVLALIGINSITVVVLVAVVATPFRLLMNTICIVALLLLQVGGTAVFTVFAPNFPCRSFGSEITCRQLTSTAIIGLWTLPGVLFFCMAWLLLILFVIRPSLERGPKTPPLIRSFDQKTDEWSPSAQSQLPYNKVTTITPVAPLRREPSMLSKQQHVVHSILQQQQTQLDAYGGIADDASQPSQPFQSSVNPPKSPELVDRISRWRDTMQSSSSNTPRLARKPPPLLDNVDDASMIDMSDGESSISSLVSVYSTMPVLGTQFRIELKLPERISTSETQIHHSRPSTSSSSSSSVTSPASAPYQYPNPSAYTRPPFSSSPLTKSFVPPSPSSSPETTSAGGPLRQNHLRTDGSVRRGNAFPVSPVSRPLTAGPYPGKPVQAIRPLIDRKGIVTSKTFRDLRDMDRERMQRRDGW